MSITSEALDCLIEWRRKLPQQDRAGPLLAVLMQHLSRAEIFKVPANGVVLPSEHLIGKSITGLLDRYSVPRRLPYGEIAIEFTHVMGSNQGAGEPWTRCVCLASDMRQTGGLQHMTKTFMAAYGVDAADGFAITSVYYHPDMKWWVPNNYMLYVSNGEIYPIPMSAEGAKDLDRGQSDLNIELQATVMLITALACSNVSPVRVEPSPALNKKRERNGKSPIRVHHVLVIGGDRSGRKDGSCGTHASPRVHLRRGHIRRLEGKNTWVNACVVGDKSRGVVTKDYAVKAAAR